MSTRRTITSHLNSLNTIKTIAYDVGNSGSGAKLSVYLLVEAVLFKGRNLLRAGEAVTIQNTASSVHVICVLLSVYYNLHW
jgi:hypothetical protein